MREPGGEQDKAKNMGTESIRARACNINTLAELKGIAKHKGMSKNALEKELFEREIPLPPKARKATLKELRDLALGYRLQSDATSRINGYAL